jgi:dephospho-CoA kinase
MLKVGLTGGIGSGKSTIAKVIEAMGYPVFYSDTEAKKIIETNHNVKIKLVQHFGAGICTENSIDRKKLAQIVFSHAENLETINSIIHPEVRNHFNKWAEKQKVKVVFNEAAILFETGAYRKLDKNIVVIAPEEIRIDRVMKRDNLSKEEVLKRIHNQWSDDLKIPLADYIVTNDNQQPILIQLEKIIQDLTLVEKQVS